MLSWLVEETTTLQSGALQQAACTWSIVLVVFVAVARLAYPLDKAAHFEFNTIIYYESHIVNFSHTVDNNISFF